MDTLLKQHPLSAAFASMSDDDYLALFDDIEIYGQRDPITIYEGMILDGWHRYRACRDCGLPPKFIEFSGDDPVPFVLARNLHRRHLTGSQRAAAVVACHEWAPAHRQKDIGANKGEAASPLSTNADMAKIANVSDRTIKDAKAAHKAGLGDAVKDGAMTAERAAQVARGTPEKPKKKVAVARTGNVATSGPTKTQAQQEADKAADDAHGDTDPIALLEELQKEHTALQAQFAAAMADDSKAEIAKWQQLCQVARNRQGELMATVNDREQQIVKLQRTLRRIGATVGESDPTRIAGKVDISMRRLNELLGMPENSNVDNCPGTDLASTARQADPVVQADRTMYHSEDDAQLPENPFTSIEPEVSASMPAPRAREAALEPSTQVEGYRTEQGVADDVEYF